MELRIRLDPATRKSYRFQIVLAGFIAVLVLTNRLPGRSGQVAWLRLAVLAS